MHKAAIPTSADSVSKVGFQCSHCVSMMLSIGKRDFLHRPSSEGSESSPLISHTAEQAMVVEHVPFLGILASTTRA